MMQRSAPSSLKSSQSMFLRALRIDLQRRETLIRSLKSYMLREKLRSKMLRLKTLSMRKT
jgi:hypothetical protein